MRTIGGIIFLFVGAFIVYGIWSQVGSFKFSTPTLGPSVQQQPAAQPPYQYSQPTAQPSSATPQASGTPVSSRQSPYAGKIQVSWNRYSDNVNYEYVTIQNNDYAAKAPIPVTGWRIENEHGTGYAIGGASPIPGINDAAERIILPYLGTVYVHTGTHNGGLSFRENACTGYLNETDTFYPALLYMCPAIPSRQELRDRGLNDACINFIQGKSSCRAVNIVPYPKSVEVGSACIEYIQETFNYAGCVRIHRAEAIFFRDQWHVYFNRTEKLFSSTYARLIIKDENGKIVQELTY